MRLLIAALAALTLATAAPAQTDADAAGVRGTIASQLKAFSVDDWAGAFAFAAPNIQGLFRTPENFGRMVRGGYPMVWRPRSSVFADLTPAPGGQLRQTVVFTDLAGAVHVADYYLAKLGGVWRITGVTLRPQVGAGA